MILILNLKSLMFVPHKLLVKLTENPNEYDKSFCFHAKTTKNGCPEKYILPGSFD